MAKISILLDNDREAVWLVELCKRLGFTKLEIGFGDCVPVAVDYRDAVATKPTGCSAERKAIDDFEKRADGNQRFAGANKKNRSILAGKVRQYRK